LRVPQPEGSAKLRAGSNEEASSGASPMQRVGSTEEDPWAASADHQEESSWAEA